VKACTNLGIDGVDLYGGTRHSSARALRMHRTPEEIKRATMHTTNKAFERYFQIEADDVRNIYRDTLVTFPPDNTDKELTRRTPLSLASHGVFKRTGIFHPFGRLKNLKAYDVPFHIIIDDDTGPVLVTLLYRVIAEEDTKHVHFRIVKHFHYVLQYFVILLVRYTVMIFAGSSVSLTMARSKNLLPLPKSMID
jgi:hypothetical protein